MLDIARTHIMCGNTAAECTAQLNISWKRFFSEVVANSQLSIFVIKYITRTLPQRFYEVLDCCNLTAIFICIVKSLPSRAARAAIFAASLLQHYHGHLFPFRTRLWCVLKNVKEASGDPEGDHKILDTEGRWV